MGVGAYRTDEGVPWVLPVVSKIEKELANDASLNHEYLPINGLPEFCDAAAKLALGDDSTALKEGRAGGVQALSGTGALRLSAEFLFRYFGGEATTVFYSKPTWGNHLDIYKAAGFTKLEPYTYWDNDTKAANIEKFISGIGLNFVFATKIRGKIIFTVFKPIVRPPSSTRKISYPIPCLCS